VNFLAVQAIYQAGLGNLIDVETARRNVLSAEMAVKELEQEQVSAWIALYRASGGSWDEPEDARKVGATIPPVSSKSEPENSGRINHQVGITGGIA
jgi:hypothetical protein